MKKHLPLTSVFAWLFALLFLTSCDTESVSPKKKTTTSGTDTSKMEGMWSRNDGQAVAYIKLSGTSAVSCSNNVETYGTFNTSKPAAIFTVSGVTYEFPLYMNGEKLMVGVPSQGTVNHVDTEYIRIYSWPCGGGTSNPNNPPTGTQAKGQVIIWTNQSQYGWKPANWQGSGDGGMNVMNVTVAGSSSSIYGGYYTSAPNCGATYCFTKSLDPGTYSVTGKVYFLKDVYGNSYPTYSTSKTFTVTSNQCTNVMLR